jgi:hypothetical protein
LDRPDQVRQQLVMIQRRGHFFADVVNQAELSGFLALLLIQLSVLNGNRGLCCKQGKNLEILSCESVEFFTLNIQDPDQSSPDQEGDCNLRPAIDNSLNIA